MPGHAKVCELYYEQPVKGLRATGLGLREIMLHYEWKADWRRGVLGARRSG